MKHKGNKIVYFRHPEFTFASDKENSGEGEYMCVGPTRESLGGATAPNTSFLKHLRGGPSEDMVWLAQGSGEERTLGQESVLLKTMALIG